VPLPVHPAGIEEAVEHEVVQHDRPRGPQRGHPDRHPPRAVPPVPQHIEKEQDRHRRVAHVQPGEERGGQGQRQGDPPRALRQGPGVAEHHHHHEGGRGLGEDEAREVQERRRERHHPRHRLGGCGGLGCRAGRLRATAPLPRPAQDVPQQPPRLPGHERRHQAHEEGGPRGPPEGVRREDQERQPDTELGVDDPLSPAHQVVRPERPRVERPVAALLVVGLHRQVPVRQEAVGHHEVVRLVPVGPHLHVNPPRRREVHGEHHDQEDPGRVRPRPAPEDEERGGQRNGQQGRTAERACAGQPQAAHHQQEERDETQRHAAGGPALPGDEARERQGDDRQDPDPGKTQGQPPGPARGSPQGQARGEGECHPPGDPPPVDAPVRSLCQRGLSVGSGRCPFTVARF
jgi:hypothetical protein